MAKPANIGSRDIVRAAMLSIEQNGIAATTLKEVARLAGVTQGTVYYHFKTKEDLLLAVIRQTIDDHLENLAAIWDDSGDLQTKIVLALTATRDRYTKNESFQRLFHSVASLALHNGRAAEVLSRQLDKVVGAVEKLCRRAMMEAGDNDLAITSEQLSRIIIAFVGGLSLQSVIHKELDVTKTYQSFIHLIRSYIHTDTEGGSKK